MKKQILFFVFLAVSAIINAQQYYIRVNGTTDYPAEQIGGLDYQGRIQYLASNVKLSAGDIITFYDALNNAEFGDAALEPYDEGANFEQLSFGYKCNVDGCYNIYLKLKWEDNTLYIGSGTNCSGETPGDTHGGNSSDSDDLTAHNYWLIGWFDGADSGESAYQTFDDKYKFNGGKLEVNFNMGSYAAVKDDEGNYYYVKDAAGDNAEGASAAFLWANGWSPCKKWHLEPGQHYLIIELTSSFKNVLNLKDVSKSEFDAHVWEVNTALNDNTAATFQVCNGTILTDGELQIYSILGQNVTAQNGSLKGMYIVSVNGNKFKLLIK